LQLPAFAQRRNRPRKKRVRHRRHRQTPKHNSSTHERP
jgi:hypothetical protein